MHQKASRLEDMDVDNQPHQRHIKSKYRKDNEPAPRFTLRVPAMESVPIKAEPLSNANSPAEQQQQQNELITPTPPTGVSNDEGTAEATITGLEAAVTAAEMTSKKRSSVDIDAENDDDQPGPKKQKTSPSPMSAIPDAPKDVIMRDASPSLDELITAKPYTGSMFDTEPMHLLERSIAIALERVGFDGATKQAMNSFKAQVDSCKGSSQDNRDS